MNRVRWNQPPTGTVVSFATRRPWLLTGLACATGLLLSHTPFDFGPGRLICGILLLNLLPGTALAGLLRRHHPVETITFGLALSPLVVTLLVYTSGFLLRLPPPAAIGSAGLVLAAALAASPHTGERTLKPLFPPEATIPLGAGLLLALLTAAGYLHSPEDMLTIHGLDHTASINQIMAGLIPPDNTHLYGHPSGYQWPAHIAPAVSSLLLGISPPLAAALQRLMAFTGLFGLGYLLARELGQRTAGRAFSGLLTVLGMNLLGGIHFLWKLALSSELRHVVLTGAYHPGLHLLLTPEAMADHLRPRICSIAVKLVNFSFIVPGYAAVMVAVLGVLQVYRGRKRSGFPLVFIGAAAALLIHPILAVMLSVPLPLALLLTRVAMKREGRLPFIALAGIIASLGLAGLFALPYLIPGMQTLGGANIATRVESRITLTMCWLFLPLLPAAVPSAVRAVRERDRRGIFITMLAVFTALFTLLQQVKCDWYQLYLLAIPLGLLAGDQLGRWYAGIAGRAWRASLAAAVILVVLSGPALRIYASTLNHRPDEGRFRFTGSTLLTLRESGSDLARAYQWVRQQTPPHAVLVEKPKLRNYEELSAVTGRRVYVGEWSSHTPVPRDGQNPMGEALDRANLLLEPGRNKRETLEELAGLPDPVYLFLRGGKGNGSLVQLAAEYDTFPGHVRLELDLDRVKIYRVLPR